MTENKNNQDINERVDVQEYQLKDGHALFDNSSSENRNEIGEAYEDERKYQPTTGSNPKHDKAKQMIAMIGGFLGALLLALRGSGVDLGWYTQESIDLWMDVLYSMVPLAFAGYGIWKNQYIVTKKARKQEEVLKEKGLK